MVDLKKKIRMKFRFHSKVFTQTADIRDDKNGTKSHIEIKLSFPYGF